MDTVQFFSYQAKQNCIVIHPTTAEQSVSCLNASSLTVLFLPQAGTSAILFQQTQVMQQIPTRGRASSLCMLHMGLLPQKGCCHCQFCMDLHSNCNQQVQTSQTNRSRDVRGSLEFLPCAYLRQYCKCPYYSRN